MKPEFPFLRTLLDDKRALGIMLDSITIAEADQLAHEFSVFARIVGAGNGVALIAMLSYTEQLAENLAKELDYDLGPQPQ